MRKNLHKLLFVVLLVSGSAIYSQTALPGTIEVENGDISNNSSHATRNTVGSGNGGTNNIIQQFRKDGGINGNIINHVSIATDGNYDFEFTYFKNKAVTSNVTINSTNSSGGSSVELASLTIVDNSATATTSSYGTVKVLNVPLTTSIEYITIVTSSTLNSDINLDNVIVTASAAAPVITLTGNSTVNHIEGDAYADAGATAVGSDGSTDISGSIVVGGATVDNTTTPGTYTITYNVSDGGTAAAEVTRTVIVHSSTTRIASQTGNWNDSASWGGKTVPTSSNDVLILDSGIDITVSNAQAANTIKNAGDLIVTTGGELSVTGNVYLSKFDFGLEVQSLTSAAAMGTLTVGGIVGTFNSSDQTTSTSDKRLYVRKTLDNDKWYLVSSMASKQPRLFYMRDSEFRDNGTSYSIAPYNNGNAALSKYDYFDNGTIVNDSNNDVPLGAGMSVSVSGTGNTNTTGEFGYKAFFSHGARVTRAISVDVGTSDAFNLIGNPYLSNLHGNDNADGTNNLLKVNHDAGVIAEQTLWFWNADTSAWVTKNQSSDAFTVPPVTGFFVKSSVAGGNFSYTTAMETHTAAGSISAKNTNQRFEIDLSIESGEIKRSSSIRYIDGTSTSFDNGYDSSIFGGYASELELYTGLLDGDASKKLAIQSLPNGNFEDMIIPVGVRAAVNSEITFKALVSNMPKGHKLYLEDRLQGTFTRLDEANGEYKVTLADAATDGRFFLHTRATSVLNLDAEFLNSVSIYTTNNTNLRIAGLKQGNVSVKLFNVLGKQVMVNSFTAINSVENVSLPTLARGIYVVQLATENGKLNKKIIIE